MAKLITVCACGKCEDTFEMDYTSTERDDRRIVRGLKITNLDTGRNETIVVPESLALVIERWMKENNGELEYDE